MREVELKKLIVEEFLAQVQDPRIERTRKHPLETILILSVLAVICGADSFVGIEKYGKAKLAWLSTFLDMSTGVPSHDTIGRVLAALDPKMLTLAFQRWTAAMATASAETLIAIDGKTLRRSFKQAGDRAFVHMVSAWSASNGVVLGQVKTDAKSNEVTAIPALLDLLEINNALITIDAAGTQTEIADKIVEKGGDYLLAVKANQPTLYGSLIEHFEGASYWSFDFFETEERAHGRHEVRRIWVSDKVESVTTGDRWRKLTTVMRVQSLCTVGDKRA